MNSIPDVGSYFVALKQKGEPENARGIKGRSYYSDLQNPGMRKEQHWSRREISQESS